jgi:peptidoglycan/xylan/chitin deacetylase (PgdA/CDA1 family)
MIELIKKSGMLSMIVVSLSLMIVAQYQTSETVDADKKFPWPAGKQCAISLTFDDARLTQIDRGIPLLNSYGVKATFYISPDTFKERLDGWLLAFEKGHEIGNHTLTHPCTGNYAFSRHNALENYTLEKMAAELDAASELIRSLIKQAPQSFAYPCGQTFVGRGEQTRSYVPLVAERFQTGRKWLNEAANDPFFCDMAQLLALESDQKSFDVLLPLIENAKAEGRWLILAGHEMADSGFQTTLLKTLDQFCRYAQDDTNGLWVDTVANVAAFIVAHR